MPGRRKGHANEWQAERLEHVGRHCLSTVLVATRTHADSLITAPS
jgi:hypothetical protein